MTIPFRIHECASQDALAEAETFRSAAQHREADLLARLAQGKLEQDALTEVSLFKVVQGNSSRTVFPSPVYRSFPPQRLQQPPCERQAVIMTRSCNRSRMRLVACSALLPTKSNFTPANMPLLLQVTAVRETNRQLDSRVERLQSYLQEQDANTKQARVLTCLF